MNDEAVVATASKPSPNSSVRRTPIDCMSAAANGPIKPKSAMLIATASEIVAADQPISRSIGSISTPGVERIPAAVSSTRNAKPAMSQG